MSRSISLVRFGIFVSLIASISTLLPSRLLLAQELPGCFMIDEQPKFINLNYICLQPNIPAERGVIVDIGTVYAGTYCDALGEKYTGPQAQYKAKNAAYEAKPEYKTYLDASDPKKVSEMAKDKIKFLCPELVSGDSIFTKDNLFK